jgi:hypothetical protein
MKTMTKLNIENMKPHKSSQLVRSPIHDLLKQLKMQIKRTKE